MKNKHPIKVSAGAPFLPISAAAVKLEIWAGGLHKLIRRGKLPRMEIGGLLSVSQADFKRLAEIQELFRCGVPLTAVPEKLCFICQADGRERKFKLSYANMLGNYVEKDQAGQRFFKLAGQGWPIYSNIGGRRLAMRKEDVEDIKKILENILTQRIGAEEVARILGYSPETLPDFAVRKDNRRYLKFFVFGKEYWFESIRIQRRDWFDREEVRAAKEDIVKRQKESLTLKQIARLTNCHPEVLKRKIIKKKTNKFLRLNFGPVSWLLKLTFLGRTRLGLMGKEKIELEQGYLAAKADFEAKYVNLSSFFPLAGRSRCWLYLRIRSQELFLGDRRFNLKKSQGQWWVNKSDEPEIAEFLKAEKIKTEKADSQPRLLTDLDLLGTPKLEDRRVITRTDFNPTPILKEPAEAAEPEEKERPKTGENIGRITEKKALAEKILLLLTRKKLLDNKRLSFAAIKEATGADWETIFEAVCGLEEKKKVYRLGENCALWSKCGSGRRKTKTA